MNTYKKDSILEYKTCNIFDLLTNYLNYGNKNKQTTLPWGLTKTSTFNYYFVVRMGELSLIPFLLEYLLNIMIIKTHLPYGHLFRDENLVSVNQWMSTYNQNSRPDTVPNSEST